MSNISLLIRLLLSRMVSRRKEKDFAKDKDHASDELKVSFPKIPNKFCCLDHIIIPACLLKDCVNELTPVSRYQLVVKDQHFSIWNEESTHFTSYDSPLYCPTSGKGIHVPCPLLKAYMRQEKRHLRTLGELWFLGLPSINFFFNVLNEYD